MRNAITIDPANLTSKHADILVAFLSGPGHETNYLHPCTKYSFFYQGKKIKFKTTCGLLKVDKGDHIFSNPKYYVFGDLIGIGSFAHVYDVKGTLSFNYSKYKYLAYKNKNKKMVVKQQYHFVDYPKRNAVQEYELMGSSPVIDRKQFLMSQSSRISYIVTNRFDGNDLSELLLSENPDSDSWSIEQRYMLTIKLLYALQEQVHENKIIHRDIKPNNIIVDSNFNAYFIDYGLSRKEGPEHEDNLSCGTRGFAAPEAYRVSKHSLVTITKSSDVFSIGRVVALLWGDKSLHDLYDLSTKSFTQALTNPVKLKLFKRGENFDVLTMHEQTTIKNIISAMVDVTPGKRIPINFAIAAFERLYFYRMAASYSNLNVSMLKAAVSLAKSVKRLANQLSQSDSYSIFSLLEMLQNKTSALSRHKAVEKVFCQYASLALYSAESVGLSTTVDMCLQRLHDLKERMIHLHLRVKQYREMFFNFSARSHSSDLLKNFDSLVKQLNHEVGKFDKRKRPPHKLFNICDDIEKKLARLRGILDYTLQSDQFGKATVNQLYQKISSGYIYLSKLDGVPPFKLEVLDRLLSFLNKDDIHAKQSFKLFGQSDALKTSLLNKLDSMNLILLSEPETGECLDQLYKHLKSFSKIGQEGYLRKIIMDSIQYYRAEIDTASDAYIV